MRRYKSLRSALVSVLQSCWRVCRYIPNILLLYIALGLVKVLAWLYLPNKEAKMIKEEKPQDVYTKDQRDQEINAFKSIITQIVYKMKLRRETAGIAMSELLYLNIAYGCKDIQEIKDHVKAWQIWFDKMVDTLSPSILESMEEFHQAMAENPEKVKKEIEGYSDKNDIARVRLYFLDEGGNVVDNTKPPTKH